MSTGEEAATAASERLVWRAKPYHVGKQSDAGEGGEVGRERREPSSLPAPSSSWRGRGRPYRKFRRFRRDNRERSTETAGDAAPPAHQMVRVYI